MGKDRALALTESLCSAAREIFDDSPMTEFSLEHLPALATKLRSRLMRDNRVFAELPARQRPALVLYALEATLGLWTMKTAKKGMGMHSLTEQELRRLLDDAIAETGQHLLAKLREPGVIR